MANTLIQWLADRPFFFDSLRWILEGGYTGHRAVIHRYICLQEQPSTMEESAQSPAESGFAPRLPATFNRDEHRQQIAEFSPRSGVAKVLDIGCGTGIYANHFSPEQYCGIDISPVYVASATARFPQHQFQQMDARSLQFSDGEFDAAFISGVLHHLSDKDAIAVLREAARVIRRTGRLVVWEDIPAPWWNAVGHVIHRLDLGANIRKADGYRSLLEKGLAGCAADSETKPPQDIQVHQMRSGFMDYAVYVCDL